MARYLAIFPAVAGSWAGRLFPTSRLSIRLNAARRCRSSGYAAKMASASGKLSASQARLAGDDLLDVQFRQALFERRRLPLRCAARGVLLLDLGTLGAQLRHLLPFGVGNLLRVLAMQQLILPDQDSRVLLRVLFDAPGESGRALSAACRAAACSALSWLVHRRSPAPWHPRRPFAGFDGAGSLVPGGGAIERHQFPLPVAIVMCQDARAPRPDPEPAWCTRDG